MTPLDIESIERREKAATVGPWATMRGWPLNIVPAEQAGFPCGASVHPQDDRRYAQEIAVVSLDTYCSPEFTHRRISPEQASVDADFISHARFDVPELVREVKRLRAIEEAARVVATGAAIFVYTGDIEDALVALDIALHAYDQATAPEIPSSKISAAVSDVGDTTGVISGTRKEQEPRP